MRTGKNHEGYSDPTASCAVGHLTHEEKQREKKRKEEKKRDKSSVLGSAHSDSSGSRSTGTVHRRDDPVLPLPAKGRQDKKRVHREAKRADEEQIQAIREMQARKEEKRQKRRQRKSEANRR